MIKKKKASMITPASLLGRPTLLLTSGSYLYWKICVLLFQYIVRFIPISDFNVLTLLSDSHFSYVICGILVSYIEAFCISNIFGTGKISFFTSDDSPTSNRHCIHLPDLPIDHR